MKILITGARGFVGRNLTESLTCLQDGRDRAHSLRVDKLWAYDTDSDPAVLCEAARECDFVIHLAGVNRSADPNDFTAGNRDFTARLLSLLRESGNPAPVMYASSTQASLTGRYAGSVYGQSKLAGEQALFAYEKETGAPVYVFRFPNVFGKWCRPNYNSAVATFCHQQANDLPLTVNDPAVELELLYVDDLVETLLRLLQGQVTRCDYDGLTPVVREGGRYALAAPTHFVTLGEIAEWLGRFRALENTLQLPDLPAGSFQKKLYSAYLSYLPPERAAFPLTMRGDERGSFTEILKTASAGQFSVNVSRPGITKGQHWHHSKWELFVVVHGRALISERSLQTGERYDFTVSGEQLQAVHMLPGWTHSITNLSDTDELVTLMWANEPFDAARPDMFYEPVEGKA